MLVHLSKMTDISTGDNQVLRGLKKLIQILFVHLRSDP